MRKNKMRVVLDLQGLQAKKDYLSDFNHMLSKIKSIVTASSGYDFFLVLNGFFSDSIEPIRNYFDNEISQEKILTWQPSRTLLKDDIGKAALELIRESFLLRISPDFIIVTDFVFSHSDNHIFSINKIDVQAPTGILLLDNLENVTPNEQPSDVKNSYLNTSKLDGFKNAAFIALFNNEFAEPIISYIKMESASIVTLGEMTVFPDNAKESEEQAAFQLLDLISHTLNKDAVVNTRELPRLAYLSPLPPAKSGIADFSAELLPALSAYYDVTHISFDDNIDDEIVAAFPIQNVEWFIDNINKFDRVLYNFGNSPFHKHMFDLIEDIPGVVILHDFFLGDIQNYRVSNFHSRKTWSSIVYESHGYLPLCEIQSGKDLKSIISNYPLNYSVLSNAVGVISHSEYSRALAKSFFCEDITKNWGVTSLLRKPSNFIKTDDVKRNLGYRDDDFIVCSFGLVGSNKCSKELINVWLNSDLSKEKNCYLIFVGAVPTDQYGEEFFELISTESTNNIIVTDYVSTKIYREYLYLADVGVQLRKNSRGETSAAVLDCMNYKLPTIINANGAMAELDPDSVLRIPDRFNQTELIEALEILWRNPDKRKTIGENAQKTILENHSPEQCAKRYVALIEEFYSKGNFCNDSLIDAIASFQGIEKEKKLLPEIAKNVSENLPLPRAAKRIFLDISVVCRDDYMTGIQRVVRAILNSLVCENIEGYRVEPVCLKNINFQWELHYAHHYMFEKFTNDLDMIEDEIVEPKNGDIFLALDFSGSYLIEAAKQGVFVKLKNCGVKTYSVVYDLLPVRVPHVFPPNASSHHEDWLNAISAFDGAICISESVANDLDQWQKETNFDLSNRRPFQIKSFRLGADIDNSLPSGGAIKNNVEILNVIASRPTFLMVGTIEPRKAYLQAIKAFEDLHSKGVDINLVIVGREGWKMLPQEDKRDIPETINYLKKTTAKPNSKIIWLEGISDEFLQRIYSSSNCLIAASHDEGFGLPLIEAAQYKLPIIARDIPVFREVAGNHAYYFSGIKPTDLSDAIASWLNLYEKESHPKSDNLPWLTWQQSAQQLLKTLLEIECD